MPEPQEKIYRGPTPTIPSLNSSNPMEFARLKIALENILPKDATERFKFQILTDQLQFEEALLVADSYTSSRYPYTDTMAALTRMYGQPHQLALQHIAELMDGPEIISGDVKAFHMFALRVRSLVSMLEQLGRKGSVELECGSHVARLLGKLPHELRSSFRRSIHPQRVPIPTLLDLADWLEYELQIQEDSTRFSSLTMLQPPARGKASRRDSKQAGKPATVLLGTARTAQGNSPSPDTHKTRESKRAKGRPYCPYCDNNNHFLNSCVNFKQLNREQKDKWIRDNNRCWRCGRGHHAARCTLKALCPTCNRQHLLVLHEVNEKATEKITEVNSCLVNTPKEVLYFGRPTYNPRVLLKINKVLLKNGDRSLEAYAVLDDGSERTILLHTAAQQLGLKATPEDLLLRTVRQDLQVLHGAVVSFTISPAAEPKRAFKIHSAFTAESLGLAEHTHPVKLLQRRYQHLAGLPLQHLDKVHPVLLIRLPTSHYPNRTSSTRPPWWACSS